MTHQKSAEKKGQSDNVVSFLVREEQMQRPISEWTPEIAVAKLTLLLDKPYRGMPLNGKELQNLPESEKERQKILNCGKSEMWKILDMVAAEKANERKSLQQFELDLVTPPMLPEEDNDRRAKLYAVHNDPKERQASLDSRSEASRIVSEIFRSDSIDMGESAATTMTITMEVPSEDAPLPPAPAHQPRALVVKAVNNEEEEEEDLEEDEEEDGMGDEQLQDETNAPSDGKRKPRPRPPPPLEDSNDVIIISKLDKVTF